MKANFRLGGILAVTGALLGILGHAVLFLNWYQTGMAAESAEPGCEILLKYILQKRESLHLVIEVTLPNDYL